MENISKRITFFERDVKWITTNYKELIKKYPKQYVAVLDKHVIEHDKNLEQLVNRLMEKCKKDYPRVVVEYINTEKVEMIL
jgi:2-polyprenyl-3-methyl-5-hydroxy-6-metoxy-1,4-benzoquinol methylase